MTVRGKCAEGGTVLLYDSAREARGCHSNMHNTNGCDQGHNLEQKLCIPIVDTQVYACDSFPIWWLRGVLSTCSTKPRVERKEYVVPLIRKNVWRLPQRRGSGGRGGEEGGKSEEEIALEREAAEAIMRGQLRR